MYSHQLHVVFRQLRNCKPSSVGPFGRSGASQPQLPSMPTTPPPNPSLNPPQGRSSATDRFNPQFANRDMILSRLANEMRPFLVGPMRAQQFLELFLPGPLDPPSLPHFTEGIFKDLIKSLSKNETKWYKVFVSSGPRRPPHCP